MVVRYLNRIIKLAIGYGGRFAYIGTAGLRFDLGDTSSLPEIEKSNQEGILSKQMLALALPKRGRSTQSNSI